MSNVDFNRVVDVVVNLNDNFPSVANFSIPLILTADAGGETAIDTDLVKAFSSIEDLEAYGFTAASDVYKTVVAMLGTSDRPRTFKVGYFDGDLDSSLISILAEDSLFYVVVTAALQVPGDGAALTQVNDILTANRKVLIFDTNDVALRDDATDTTGLGAQLRTISNSRLFGWYVDAVTAPEERQQYAAKVAAYISAVNYNDVDSHYTMKFKELDGAKPANLSNLTAQNITGFLPATGLNAAAGGFLNTYVCTAGQNYTVEGVATDGTFIDTITFNDWLVATMQQNVLAVYLNNKVVPYDETGINLLIGAVVQTLAQGLASGALTDRRLDSNGTDYLPAYEISVQDLDSVAPSLVAQRIAPEIQFCGRYANGVHYGDVEGTLKLVS